MLLSLLGLRPAEVCGMRWADVDLAAETISVVNARTLVATDGGMVVVEKGPKSSAGQRTLPLPAQATTALTRLRTMQAAERLAAGPAYSVTGYVLVDEIGEPCRTDWLRRRAYEAMARASVRKVGRPLGPELGVSGVRAPVGNRPGAGSGRADRAARLSEIN